MSPRKELFEAWEMAKRVRWLFRGGRVVDLGAGHSLLRQVMLLLDDSSPSALVVDRLLPPSSRKVHDVLVEAWPRLAGRVEFVVRGMDDPQVEISSTDVVVSSHACGGLTDVVLGRALSARARLAVLPCCHDLASPIEETSMAGSTVHWPSMSREAVRLGRRVSGVDAFDTRRHHAEKSSADRSAGMILVCRSSGAPDCS
jgi:hypothetical protein